jgi:hypothetical protein
MTDARRNFDQSLFERLHDAVLDAITRQSPQGSGGKAMLHLPEISCALVDVLALMAALVPDEQRRHWIDTTQRMLTDRIETLARDPKVRRDSSAGYVPPSN